MQSYSNERFMLSTSGQRFNVDELQKIGRPIRFYIKVDLFRDLGSMCVI